MHRFSKISCGLLIAFMIAGCGGERAEPDPYTALTTPTFTRHQHRQALATLDETAPNDPQTLEVLHQIVSRDTTSIELREAALDRLADRDLENLKRTIRQTLPRSSAWGWVVRCSEIIAERGWVDLSPALVSSWARYLPSMRDDLQRPEYKALAKLHGEANVTDVVFVMFMESRSVGEQGLRTRCWDLLHRLGQRDRLLQLLANADQIEPDDAMLLDLRAGAAELGLVPSNREEILWLRKLRSPEHAEFWSRAVNAVQALSAERRAQLELRDLPILVSATLHDPHLLRSSFEDLYAQVDEYTKTQPRYVQDSNYDSIGVARQRLYEHRDVLTWGDLAAMQIAIRAMQIPEVVTHLFSYADRDMADESTEYGGVIALDTKDRIEVREFQPVMRRHDQEFIASQAMLDAAYTSIFHFHMHAQKYDNRRFAGPGFGDHNYADNTRANCLVFTFINKDTMNVDYYRHGRVVVDLGVIKRR